MSCERWSPILSGYLDGELSVLERQKMEEHLRSCLHCRRELSAWRRTSEALSTQCFPDPGFLVRFRARRDSERTHSAGGWKWLTVRLVPVALLALLASAALILPSDEPDDFAALEARTLGGDALADEGFGSADPVLQIALEPFPMQESRGR